MNDTIVTRIEKAEALLNNRNFREGLRLVKAINSDVLAEDQRPRVSLLEAELSLHLNITPDERDILTALAYYKKSTDTAGYARAKFVHGWMLTRVGDFFDAREVYIEAYVHYKRCDDRGGCGNSDN